MRHARRGETRGHPHRSVLKQRTVIFGIDDSFNTACGGQQLTFRNLHHDERSFAPMNVYNAGIGVPVATIMRPA
jgi:hypothetical protein